MSIGIHLDTSTIPVTIAGFPAASSADASSTQAAPAPALKSGGAPGAGAASSGPDAGSTESATVKALQREIAQLQKQLAQEQQALHEATSSGGAPDPAGMARIAALQSAVATTSGQLEAAVTALAAALLQEGSGSAGSLVSASA